MLIELGLWDNESESWKRNAIKTILLSLFSSPTHPLHLLLPPDLPHESMKDVVDKVPETRRSLEEWTPELRGQQFPLFGGNCPLVLQIQFIRDQHEGNVLRQSHPLNQLPVLAGLLEGPSIRYRVANDETFAASHVLVPHRRELHLPSSVQYVQQSCLAIDYRLLLICVLCGMQKKSNFVCQREAGGWAANSLVRLCAKVLTNCGIVKVLKAVPHKLKCHRWMIVFGSFIGRQGVKVKNKIRKVNLWLEIKL